MKYFIPVLAGLGLYGFAYALISNLTPEASAMISGGLLVLGGVLAMGIVAIFLVGVVRPRPQREERPQLPYQQPPVIMFGGPPMGSQMHDQQPPVYNQHYLPLPKPTVEHEEW